MTEAAASALELEAASDRVAADDSATDFDLEEDLDADDVVLAIAEAESAVVRANGATVVSDVVWSA